MQKDHRISRTRLTHQGFSLVELLVALFVFSLLSAFAFRAVNALSKASESIEVQQRELTELQRALVLWERDMRQLVAGTQRDTQVLLENSEQTTDGQLLASFVRAETGTQQAPVQVRYVLSQEQLFREQAPVAEAWTETKVKRQLLLKGVQAGSVQWLGSMSSERGSISGVQGAELQLQHATYGLLRRSVALNLVKADQSLNTLGGKSSGTEGPQTVNPDLPDGGLDPSKPKFEW